MSRRWWTAMALVGVVVVGAGAWLILRPAAQRVTLVALDERSGRELWRTELPRAPGRAAVSTRK